MIYQYRCKHGHDFERVLPVADYRTPQTCECGAEGRRIISVPRLVTVQPECNYDSPIDGKPITSWKQRQEDLARSGCRPYDPEMKTDAERFRKRQDQELDKAIEQTVEAQIETMPGKKREQLDRELTSGADINIERRSV
jgi:putative FmdB family regulatory protein